MRLTTIILAIFFLVSFFSIAVANDAPSGVIRATKADPSTSRKPSIFIHSKHDDYDCELCHHTWDGESDIETCVSCHPIFRHTESEHLHMECKECHGSWEMTREIKECGECHDDNDKGGIPNIVRVSHRALCKRCHREMEKENKPTGPTSPCTACHREE